MGDSFPIVKVAAVQAAPILLDREATTAKACRLIEEQYNRGAIRILVSTSTLAQGVNLTDIEFSGSMYNGAIIGLNVPSTTKLCRIAIAPSSRAKARSKLERGRTTRFGLPGKCCRARLWGVGHGRAPASR